MVLLAMSYHSVTECTISACVSENCDNRSHPAEKSHVVLYVGATLVHCAVEFVAGQCVPHQVDHAVQFEAFASLQRTTIPTVVPVLCDRRGPQPGRRSSHRGRGHGRRRAPLDRAAARGSKVTSGHPEWKANPSRRGWEALQKGGENSRLRGSHSSCVCFFLKYSLFQGNVESNRHM